MSDCSSSSICCSSGKVRDFLFTSYTSFTREKNMGVDSSMDQEKRLNFAEVILLKECYQCRKSCASPTPAIGSIYKKSVVVTALKNVT